MNKNGKRKFEKKNDRIRKDKKKKLKGGRKEVKKERIVIKWDLIFHLSLDIASIEIVRDNVSYEDKHCPRKRILCTCVYILLFSEAQPGKTD